MLRTRRRARGDRVRYVFHYPTRIKPPRTRARSLAPATMARMSRGCGRPCRRPVHFTRHSSPASLTVRAASLARRLGAGYGAAKPSLNVHPLAGRDHGTSRPNVPVSTVAIRPTQASIVATTELKFATQNAVLAAVDPAANEASARSSSSPTAVTPPASPCRSTSRLALPTPSSATTRSSATYPSGQHGHARLGLTICFLLTRQIFWARQMPGRLGLTGAPKHSELAIPSRSGRYGYTATIG